MPANVTTLHRAPRRREGLLRLSLLASSFLVLTYYALNHGSYSLLDRQQMAVFVWVGIGVAAICGVLPAVKPPRVLLIPLAAILAFAAWTLLSLAWTESAERTFAEFARLVSYLGVLVLVWIGVGRTTWRLVAAGLLSAGVLVCFLTMLSRFWPALFPSDTVAINLKTTRINYPFGYWNAVGCWSAMTITLCLAYAGHARSGVVRALALAAVPMCSVGLYLALSRAGFGGAVVGAVAVVVLAESRWLTFLQAVLAAVGSGVVLLALRSQDAILRGTGTEGAWSVALVLAVVAIALGVVAWLGARNGLDERLRLAPRRGRSLGIVTSVIVVLGVAALAAMYGERAYNQFTGKDVVVYTTTTDSRLSQLNGNRHNIWSSAADAFSENPLLGIGPGTFEFWWSRDAVNGEFVRDAHNLFLETLAELGVIGLALLLAFFVGLLWAAWRTRVGLSRDRARGAGVHGGLIAVFLVFLVQASVDWMWESTAVAAFALVAIALACAAGSARREPVPQASTFVGLLLVSIAAVFVLLPGLANQRQIDKSQAAFRAGELERSLSAANDAIRAESWSATAYGQRALALQAAGKPEEALVAISLAEKKEPYNWRWPLIASRINVELGRPEAAAVSLRQARSLRPYLAVFGRRDPAHR